MITEQLTKVIACLLIVCLDLTTPAPIGLSVGSKSNFRDQELLRIQKLKQIVADSLQEQATKFNRLEDEYYQLFNMNPSMTINAHSSSSNSMADAKSHHNKSAIFEPEQFNFASASELELFEGLIETIQ